MATINRSHNCNKVLSTKSYDVYQSNTYAQLYKEQQICWGYINNEYHRCKIIKVLHPKNSSHSNDNHDSNNTNDTDDEFDENEATPPITNDTNDNMSNCSTPPPTTQFDEDCSTPEPQTEIKNDSDDEINQDNDINDGLCDSSMPIYLVLCLTPRYKHDIACKHFLDNEQCKFNHNNKCLFSHG